MTAQAFTGTRGFLARYEGLKDHLPGDPMLRASAAEAFRRLGVPGGTAGRRDEAWKYTSLRALAEASFSEPLTLLQTTDNAALASRVPAIGARILFIDGRYQPDLSDPPPGIGFRRFADHPCFGTLARPDRDPLVALNTMLAEDGVCIDVPPGMDAGIVHLISIATQGAGRSTAFHPRHLVRLGTEARLTLVETSFGDGAYLHNPVTELHIGNGASLDHVRLRGESEAAFHLSTTYAEICGSGRYDSFVLTTGARVSRTETHVRLAEPDASVHLNGAQLLHGVQHADFTAVVRHDAPRCASRQAVKNVLAGRSRAVFQGRIEVARVAQKTDGYQMSQSLLLSPDAEIDTKPELEIFADDVKCSHGATVGELDQDQLFYLRTRGVPEPEAREILVRAFLHEALQLVANEPARALLEDAVAHWWEGQAA
ncbi:MAG TPA: Fe-S cluster assembly protein SufD [Acetobacteraceae bacterium]